MSDLETLREWAFRHRPRGWVVVFSYHEQSLKCVSDNGKASITVSPAGLSLELSQQTATGKMGLKRLAKALAFAEQLEAERVRVTGKSGSGLL